MTICRRLSRRLITLSCLALTSAAFANAGHPLNPQPVDAEDSRAIFVVLDRLYRSFSYGDDEAPDWVLMRSVFVDDAQVVLEAKSGMPPEPLTVDAFIEQWQASLEKQTDPVVGYDEWVGELKLHRVGQLVRADVLFGGRRTNDPHARKPGLDTLMLIETNGEWKVLSFVVQYEAKL